MAKFLKYFDDKTVQADLHEISFYADNHTFLRACEEAAQKMGWNYHEMRKEFELPDNGPKYSNSEIQFTDFLRTPKMRIVLPNDVTELNTFFTLRGFDRKGMYGIILNDKAREFQTYLLQALYQGSEGFEPVSDEELALAEI